MPELVPEGPRIPVHLMNEVDEGSVVFFCGAGVSVGDGSNLPNFEELVEHVYEANRIEADRNLSTTLRHRRFLFTDSFLLLWKWRVG